MLYIAHDRTLQAIVYKMVAHLERNELERQIRFYDAKQLDYPAQLKHKLEQYNRSNEHNQLLASVCKEKSELIRRENDKENQMQNYHRDDEPIAICLEPLDGLKVTLIYLAICYMHIFLVKFLTWC